MIKIFSPTSSTNKMFQGRYDLSLITPKDNSRSYTYRISPQIAEAETSKVKPSPSTLQSDFKFLQQVWEGIGIKTDGEDPFTWSTYLARSNNQEFAKIASSHGLSVGELILLEHIHSEILPTTSKEISKKSLARQLLAINNLPYTTRRDLLIKQGILRKIYNASVRAFNGAQALSSLRLLERNKQLATYQGLQAQVDFLYTIGKMTTLSPRKIVSHTRSQYPDLIVGEDKYLSSI